MSALILLLTLSLAAGLAQVKLPDYEERTLDNGVVVQLMSKPDVPMITLAVSVRGGAESDPAGKAGLASITAQALRRGTRTRTAVEFSEELDSIGGSFSVSVDEQSTYIVSEFMSKDLEAALDLAADAILAPTFPEAEIRKLLDQRIDAVRASKDSPRGVTGRYFREFFYPQGHPYSRQIGGDELTLGAIGRQDLSASHSRMYAGQNLVVTAVGDLDTATLGPRLASLFGRLPSGERYQWRERTPGLSREKPRLLLVDKPKATQTFFMIGQPGISRTDPDRVPMALINTLFGGRFTSMLNDELRVNAGLTYGAFCRVDRDRLRGAVTIDTFTETDRTAEAIDLALEVLGRLHEKGVDREQLASAKAYVKGRYPTRSLETSGQLAAILSGLEIFSLGRDEIDHYFEKIDAVTLVQANAVIKKHYRLDNLQFVLVGDASKIKDQIAKYAKTPKVIAITNPGFRSE